MPLSVDDCLVRLRVMSCRVDMRAVGCLGRRFRLRRQPICDRRWLLCVCSSRVLSRSRGRLVGVVFGWLGRWGLVLCGICSSGFFRLLVMLGQTLRSRALTPKAQGRRFGCPRLTCECWLFVFPTIWRCLSQGAVLVLFRGQPFAMYV